MPGVVGETVEDGVAWPERVETVTGEGVTAAVRRYLRPDRAVTGLLLPAA